MLGLLVRGQAQRTDMRTMGLAGQHVGPLEILVADMASQHRGRGIAVLVVHGQIDTVVRAAKLVLAFGRGCQNGRHYQRGDDCHQW